MTELKNVKKKEIHLKGGVSAPDRDVITSVQTETETPEMTLIQSEFFTLDDGTHFDPSKLFIDKFTGQIVSVDSTVKCGKCGARVFVEVARRVWLTGEYLCPNHGSWLRRALKNLFAGLLPHERKD